MICNSNSGGLPGHRFARFQCLQMCVPLRRKHTFAKTVHPHLGGKPILKIWFMPGRGALFIKSCSRRGGVHIFNFATSHGTSFREVSTFEHVHAADTRTHPCTNRCTARRRETQFADHDLRVHPELRTPPMRDKYFTTTSSASVGMCMPSGRECHVGQSCVQTRTEIHTNVAANWQGNCNLVLLKHWCPMRWPPVLRTDRDILQHYACGNF